MTTLTWYNMKKYMQPMLLFVIILLLMGKKHTFNVEGVSGKMWFLRRKIHLDKVMMVTSEDKSNTSAVPQLHNLPHNISNHFEEEINVKRITEVGPTPVINSRSNVNFHGKNWTATIQILVELFALHIASKLRFWGC